MPSLPDPDLPEPAHPDLDSMLSRKFGKEIANYFSGSPLNRLSFLRTDHAFLSAALTHQSTAFLLVKDLCPLTKSPDKLQFLPYKDVQSLVSEETFVKSEEKLIEEYNSTITTPQLIFLGIDESRKDGLEWKNYRGAPHWALDVTPKGSHEKEANALIETVKSQGLEFLEGRVIMSLPAPEGATYALARALLDWNARNPFCAGCGQPTLSVNAGFKRACPPTDFAGQSLDGAVGSTTPVPPTQRPSCATRTGISNLSFPRTDPTIITAVLSADGQRILLGRQKRWPKDWYSTLAGFCEPAESIEEAVRREVWEESGVSLGRVVIHSTQPWPYPANLMIGAIGQCVAGGEEIHLKHDPELEDARWFSTAEVREALRVGTSILGGEAGPDYKEGSLRLPPKTAIANQLLTAVSRDGFLGGVHSL